MTILAGVFSRVAATTVDAALCDNLDRVISRYPGDERTIFRDQRTYLVKVDTGAYGEPAIHADHAGAVSLMAGEPLLNLDDSGAARGRRDDLNLLHEAWKQGNWDLLRRAQGAFCAVHYQPDAGRLTLVADKLGVRQLYYFLSDQILIFATALRVLENLGGWPKIMDLRSVTEMAALGFPLGSRTPYCNVRLLTAAEILTASDAAVYSRQYWRWDALPPSGHSDSELSRALYDKFATAVARRLRRDTGTVSFLSGGLDSRSIVALLRDRDVCVHTFNFALVGTQDQVLARAFARRAGTLHEETTPTVRARPQWSMLMAAALNGSRLVGPCPVERPRLVWSGDGGSVALGHVYMNRRMVDLLRMGRCDAALDLFLQQQGASVLQRLVQPQVGDALADILRTGLREEIDDIRCDDPARRFHILLMLNDQRRHLAAHFEDIDLHRLEFHLPFFDSGLLELVLASRIDGFLGHGLYMRFIAHLPPVVTSVPWQTYPGHAPCPLPMPPGVSGQWEDRTQAIVRRSMRRELLRHADSLLGDEGFPDQLLRRSYLQAVRWMHGLALRDYSFVIETAGLYHRYWNLCNGRYELTAQANPSLA